MDTLEIPGRKYWSCVGLWMILVDKFTFLWSPIWKINLLQMQFKSVPAGPEALAQSLIDRWLAMFSQIGFGSSTTPSGDGLAP